MLTKNNREVKINQKKYEVKDIMTEEIINKTVSIHNMCEATLSHTDL